MKGGIILCLSTEVTNTWYLRWLRNSGRYEVNAKPRVKDQENISNYRRQCSVHERIIL